MKRERLLGLKYRVAGLQAEVRKACRDELKILYEGGPFGREAWAALAGFGATHVLEASKLNPRMKDVYRVWGEQLRLEGALGGTTLHAFFGPVRRSASRHAVERALAQCFRAQS